MNAKYKCRMCGTIAISPSMPAMCAACGADEFELLPFDARCKKCGAEYYKDGEKHEKDHNVV